MTGAEMTTHWLRAPADLSGAFAVREQVFCVEQGVPFTEELDPLDDDALHLLVLDGQRTIATLRLLLFGEQAKIGRVAVEADWRRRGIASRMLELALARAREQGAVNVRLASQVQAVGLYERVGFVVESEPFDDAGIPHVWMGLSLASPATV